MQLKQASFAASLAAVLACGVFAPIAQAQQVYRIVGPDGKVTFSDKPPIEPATKAAPVVGKPAPTGNTTVTATGPGAATTLPFELRQVVTRYPVTLYSGKNCGPCGAARAYLAGRGVPVVEKTVNTNEDIEALQRLTSGAVLPSLTIGGQQLKGFSETEWGQFLDAAGYPRTSQLPSGFRQAPPTALVTIQPAAAPQAAAEAAPPAAPALPPPPPPGSNPAGIVF